MSAYILGGCAESTDGIRRLISLPFRDLLFGYDRIILDLFKFHERTRFADRLVVEVAWGPITEILLYKNNGVRLVCPLPAEIQNYTSYTAVTMTGKPNAAEARALVRFLGGAGKPLFVDAGVE